MIYSALAKGPYKVAGYHDPDSKRFIGILYRPDGWVTETVYYLRGADDYDVVIPTTFNGFYYKVVNPGVSGTTEPTWPTTVGDTVDDGTVTWEAVAYNLLPDGQDISDSTWTATTGVTLASDSFTASSTTVMITAVDADLTTFTLTNHTVRSNNEEEDVTLQFKVAQR